MISVDKINDDSVNGVTPVRLDPDRLGDPTYERGDDIRHSQLTFYGKGADYVAEMLDEARAERTRSAIVREYTTLYASPSMPARELEKVLSEFSLRLLDSSAVRVWGRI